MMTVTPTDLALLVTAVCSGLGSLLVSCSSLVTAVRATKKLDGLRDVADKVHTLTNGNLTAALEGKVKALRAKADALQLVYSIRGTQADYQAFMVASNAAHDADAELSTRRTMTGESPA